MDVIKATTITWRPEKYRDTPLVVSDWIEKHGWDFVGAVVDIQLRHALLDEGIGDWSAGNFFWVKYTGTIEGFEENYDATCKGEKINYHFGVDKFGKQLYIFRDVNIHDIRNHWDGQLGQGEEGRKRANTAEDVMEEMGQGRCVGDFLWCA